jgi:GAF domain-containing protein
LRRGLTVADVAGQFAAAGFPLPPAMAQQLQTWQARAGRHHLYDNLAAVELSEDVLLAEIQAIAHLLGVPIYQASPRCLLVLEPAAVPRLADELVRRGYTPKVLP